MHQNRQALARAPRVALRTTPFALASIASGAVLVLMTLPSSAAPFCSEPSKPYCVDGSGYFDDEFEFDRCKIEVESYVSDVETYAGCLDRARSEAVQEANEAIEQFNCRAEGRSYC